MHVFHRRKEEYMGFVVLHGKGARDERQTATLVKGKPLKYAGKLYSEEHGRKCTTEKAGVQVLKDPTDGTMLVLAIDRKPIAGWFKEQFEKIRQDLRQSQSRGMKP